MAQVPSEIQDIYPKDGSPVSDALVKSRPCDNTLLEDTGLMAKVEETAFQLLCQQSLITHPCCALCVNDPQEDSDFFSLTFPKKLWKIVESNKFKSVCWDEEGTSIVINVELFKKEVLERKPPFRIFETNSMNSLVRQLNLYGFSKVQQNCQRSASLDDFMAEEKEGSAKFKFYRNPNFIRGHPHLLLRMKRRVGVKNASRATASLVPEFNSTLRTQNNIDKHNCGLVDEAREQKKGNLAAEENVHSVLNVHCVK
uniref:heat shock transcription factor, Y-linked-like n=1 Tax=Jaculus jaculus TaxID=51337 RepID=UPI001E1AFF7E|nr:heat shock transcription factor, Y-linked-like [Jaculus jaculus]